MSAAPTKERQAAGVAVALIRLDQPPPAALPGVDAAGQRQRRLERRPLGQRIRAQSVDLARVEVYRDGCGTGWLREFGSWEQAEAWAREGG